MAKEGGKDTQTVKRQEMANKCETLSRAREHRKEQDLELEKNNMDRSHILGARECYAFSNKGVKMTLPECYHLSMHVLSRSYPQ